MFCNYKPHWKKMLISLCVFETVVEVTAWCICIACRSVWLSPGNSTYNPASCQHILWEKAYNCSIASVLHSCGRSRLSFQSLSFVLSQCWWFWALRRWTSRWSIFIICVLLFLFLSLCLSNTMEVNTQLQPGPCPDPWGVSEPVDENVSSLFFSAFQINKYIF